MGDTVDTTMAEKNMANKDHLEHRSGDRNAHSRLQVQMEEGGSRV